MTVPDPHPHPAGRTWRAGPASRGEEGSVAAEVAIAIPVLVAVLLLVGVLLARGVNARLRLDDAAAPGRPRGQPHPDPGRRNPRCPTDSYS